MRVVRVPLATPSSTQWRALREHARRAARFGNTLMCEWYVALIANAKRPSYTLPPQEGLADAVRGALSSDAEGVWARHRARIKRGEQGLPLFTVNRALTVRVRDRGVGLLREGDGYTLTLRLDAGRDPSTLTRLPLYMPGIAKDRYLAERLAGLAAETIRKATLQFHGKKLYALLAYEVTLPPVAPEGRRATLGPVEKDGALWLRLEQADGRVRPENQSGRVHSLVTRKEQWEGLIKRLRRDMRRTGPAHRQAYRRKLARANSYNAWARSYVHEWSAHLIELLVREQISVLTITGLVGAGLPLAELTTRLSYKARERGIVVRDVPDPADPTTYRALAAPVARQERAVGRQRKAVRVLREALGSQMPGANAQDDMLRSARTEDAAEVMRSSRDTERLQDTTTGDVE